MNLLTKVAKGVAFGDVSNQSVRNILTELSKSLYGGITEQEIEDTMKFFDWECPYTGIPLKKELDNKTGNYAADHIYPQNRDECGMNVKGNLIIVSKEANKAKRGLNVKKFMEEDSAFWTNLGIDKPTRMARLKKIEDFQKDCGYDPDKIRTEISPLLNAHYAHIRDEQEKCIKNALDILDKAGIHTIVKSPSVSKKATTPTSATTKSKKIHSIPELIFHPSDEKLFKTELLKSQKAYFELTYDSGKTVKSPWDAKKFKSTSDLRGNIESKTFWRNKTREGLVKIEVFID